MRFRTFVETPSAQPSCKSRIARALNLEAIVFAEGAWTIQIATRVMIPGFVVIGRGISGLLSKVSPG
jgi:hypothetical protein